MTKLAMIAFGGNALLRAGQKGTFPEQVENVQRTCENLVPLLEQGYHLVIGHGNGPQVGNGLLRHQAGESMHGLPAQPMDFCGAETQGSIAYLIETGMDRVLSAHGLNRRVVSLVTRVEVKADDPGFRNPTKPVGPYYPEKPAEGTFREDPKGRGWRKVVASPVPVGIQNVDLVGRLAREGYVVVTVGGGGIPVIREGGALKGVEAVIDKDLASALCANEIGADEFYILTDVPKVYINFRQGRRPSIRSPWRRPVNTWPMVSSPRAPWPPRFAPASFSSKTAENSASLPKQVSWEIPPAEPESFNKLWNKTSRIAVS